MQDLIIRTNFVGSREFELSELHCTELFLLYWIKWTALYYYRVISLVLIYKVNVLLLLECNVLVLTSVSDISVMML